MRNLGETNMFQKKIGEFLPHDQKAWLLIDFTLPRMATHQTLPLFVSWIFVVMDCKDPQKIKSCKDWQFFIFRDLVG